MEAAKSDSNAPRRTRATVTKLGDGLSVHRPEVVLVASLFALAAVFSQATIRLLANLPFQPAVVPPVIRATVTVGTPLVVAGALVTIALTDDRPTVQVGVLFAAIFGSLGLFVAGAVLPALVAVAGGTAVSLLGTLGVPEKPTYRSVRRRLIAVGLVAGVTVSLAAGAGLFSGGHGAGAALALASVAALGTRAERSMLAAGSGVLGAAIIVYVAGASPYVVGSALLVVLAVTGVPHLLVALAAAGGVAAAVAGFVQRSYLQVVGASLLVLAGVPVTLPRAMSVLLGAALVLLEWQPTREVTS